MSIPDVERQIRERFRAIRGELNERTVRLLAAAEARVLGHGGVTIVGRATGLSRPLIYRGLSDLDEKRRGIEEGRVRRAGAGRPTITAAQPDLLEALDALVEPARGDPMTPLRWTCKSLRRLAEELGRKKFKISASKVGELLHEQGYSLQGNRKTLEGTEDHPDRDAQFKHISREVTACQKRGQPVISVDTKKKELVGTFKNAGKEWRPKGSPEEVNVYDFIDKDLGKVIPYGVYDLDKNIGWVNVGIDHDTPEFAVSSIRRWWTAMGASAYRSAKELLITADGGGSNGYRPRAWKFHLQEFANDTGLQIRVAHFPPGTSKWNKIEHRMFCHITQNWRGRPLTTREVVVNLIASTTTKTGLRIKADLDTGRYPKGEEISDDEMEKIKIEPASFHGEWNYRIAPS